MTGSDQEESLLVAHSHKKHKKEPRPKSSKRKIDDKNTGVPKKKRSKSSTGVSRRKPRLPTKTKKKKKKKKSDDESNGSEDSDDDDSSGSASDDGSVYRCEEEDEVCRTMKSMTGQKLKKGEDTDAELVRVFIWKYLWPKLKFITSDEELACTGRNSIMRFVTSGFNVKPEHQLVWWAQQKHVVMRAMKNVRSQSSTNMKKVFMSECTIIVCCYHSSLLRTNLFPR